MIGVAYCVLAELAIDESGLEDSSLLTSDQHSPPSPSSHPHPTYCPTMVDIPRFQKLVEHHGEMREQHGKVGEQCSEGRGKEEMMMEEGAPQTISSETHHTRGTCLYVYIYIYIYMCIYMYKHLWAF